MRLWMVAAVAGSSLVPVSAAGATGIGYGDLQHSTSEYDWTQTVVNDAASTADLLRVELDSRTSSFEYPWYWATARYSPANPAGGQPALGGVGTQVLVLEVAPGVMSPGAYRLLQALPNEVPGYPDTHAIPARAMLGVTARFFFADGSRWTGVFVDEPPPVGHRFPAGRFTLRRLDSVDSAVPTAALEVPVQLPVLSDVVLSGAPSADPDGTLVYWQWTLLEAPAPVTVLPGPGALQVGASVRTGSAALPVRFAATGRYRVGLVVWDNSGRASSPAQAEFIVTDPYPPTGVLDLPTGAWARQGITASAARSIDAGGRVVNYRWTLVAGPAASVSGPGLVTLVPQVPVVTEASSLPLRFEVPGTYRLQLVVTDDSGNDGAAVQADLLVSEPAAPTAVIDLPATAAVPADLVLSGQRSTDPDSRIVGYDWALVSAPAATASGAGFVAMAVGSGVRTDASTLPVRLVAPGRYRFQLVVTDDFGLTSQPVHAEVVASDTLAPTAVLDAPASVQVAQIFGLSAARSTDSGGRVVRYIWTLVSAPAATSAGTGLVAFSPGVPLETASPDIGVRCTTAGEYVFRLAVLDDSGNVSPVAASKVIVKAPAAPTAVLDVPPSQPVLTDTTLSAARSFDADGLLTLYQWTLLSGPAATAAGNGLVAMSVGLPVQTPTNALPIRFVHPGRYRLQLVVVDDTGMTSKAVEAEVAATDPYAPTAVLDAPAKVPASSDFSISAARSSDVGGQIAAYLYTLVSGPAPSVTGPGLASLSVGGTVRSTQPKLSLRLPTVGTYRFQLVVLDGAGNRSAAVAREVLVAK